ncbi:MAG: NIL domain-containing protein [Scytonematopsis contorta HA4267-MV1]|nr:NIL domain-containing protein [Scytonematopsis contorta HA4267-MV1]
MSRTKFPKITPLKSLIKMPGNYHRQPVISRLVSRYGLTLNITAASLGHNHENDGWFEIEMSGNSEQLVLSLSYLQQLGVDVLELGIHSHLKPSENLPFSALFHNQEKHTKNNYLSDFSGNNVSSSNSESRTVGSKTTRLRLQLCILKMYQNKPVISRLISDFGTIVNINSASLKSDVKDDGWFDLELWGKPQQINSSLNYLEKLKLPHWINDSHSAKYYWVE